MPIEAVQDLMKDRNNLVALAREREVEATVEEGLEDDFITPSMREWVTAFCPKIPIVLPSSLVRPTRHLPICSNLRSTASLHRPSSLRHMMKSNW
ncbi:phage protease [Aliiroseovarius crassostreae]|nr:phage protease [Aliiroseovarius crassostreae]